MSAIPTDTMIIEAFRDCDTCARPGTSGGVCPLKRVDLDTCLNNSSRPFWRPRDGLNKRWEKVQDHSLYDPPGKWLCDECAFKSTHPMGSPCVSCKPGKEHGSKFQPKYLPTTQDLIRDECDVIRELLLEKNRKYGDSAVHPVRIFSRADPVAQIDVRIDDKLSRIRSAQDDDTEDPELDLIGYLILKRVAKRRFEHK